MGLFTTPSTNLLRILKNQVLLIEVAKVVIVILFKGIGITVSGRLGDDAKHYQEKEVAVKIKRSKK